MSKQEALKERESKMKITQSAKSYQLNLLPVLL